MTKKKALELVNELLEEFRDNNEGTTYFKAKWIDYCEALQTIKSLINTNVE